MLEVESVGRDSPATRAGLRVGDRIARVNGQPIRDALDFHFLVSGEDAFEIEVERALRSERLHLDRAGEVDHGLRFVPDRIRTCGNECVFCFIDQNPSGLRPTLYVKDEDYRLSFLHGNFVTLTNMKEWEIRRVVEQRLSPIYLSIHSMNPETRRRLLRARRDREVGPILDYFRDHEITMHTQVVLCPGYNEGEDLEGTILGLAAYYPAIRSLAIVPLGMTDHREGLTPLRSVTKELGLETVASVERHQAKFLRQWGVRFVYLADEWYRLLGRPVPPAAHYDGFPQIENGIGMTRNFLNRLARQRRVFPRANGRTLGRVTVVTGSLFQPILEPALRTRLSRRGESVELQVIGVENEFFGRSVTVAGLLVGRDILRALDGRDLGDLVLLPPATLNDDDRFLDDMRLTDLQGALSAPVQVGFRDRWW